MNGLIGAVPRDFGFPIERLDGRPGWFQYGIDRCCADPQIGAMPRTVPE